MVLARWSAPAFVAAYVLVSFSATPNPMMALWRPLRVYALRSFFAARLPADHAGYADDVTPLSVISRLTSVTSTRATRSIAPGSQRALEPLTMSPYTGQEP